MAHSVSEMDEGQQGGVDEISKTTRWPLATSICLSGHGGAHLSSHSLGAWPHVWGDSEFSSMLLSGERVAGFHSIHLL